LELLLYNLNLSNKVMRGHVPKSKKIELFYLSGVKCGVKCGGRSGVKCGVMYGVKCGVIQNHPELFR